MLGQEIRNPIAAQRAAAGAGEGRIGRRPRAGAQPAPQHRDRVLPQRGAALLASLALTPHMGAGAEHDVLAAQPNQLRDPQPCLQRDQQQRMVALPRPRAPIGGGQERLHLRTRQEPDRAAIVPFARHRQHALDHGTVRRVLQGQVAEERVDGGQPDVARPRTVATRLLQMVEEGADEWGVEILNREADGSFLSCCRANVRSKRKVSR